MIRYIKISLIAIVAIGIASAVFYFLRGVGPEVEKLISSIPFEKRIEKRAKQEISGQQHDSARIAFLSIMDEIVTEASITLGNGHENLSSSEVEKCKKIAFYEYEPIFYDYSQSYFKKSSWFDADLKQLKENAQSLLDLSVTENNSSTYKELKQVIADVGAYFDAKKLISRASHCTSVSGIKTIKREADNFLRTPLTNNASLSAGLRSAESEAKKSVIRSIISECNRVADNYGGFSSYSAFVDAYDKANSRIDEYKNVYGEPSELSSARSRMKSVDNQALEYLSNRERREALN